jgi:hypothetical protein
MALKASAKYVRGISRVRFIPHNGNGTFPGATSALGGVFGGAGPFDFSGPGVTLATVPMTIKLDGAAEITKNLVLTSYSGHASAILASEIVAAITSAAWTNLTASVDGTTGRIKIVMTTGAYLQVYGQAAELAGFGRGIGASFLKSDTLESITVVPNKKADETDTVTDANGNDTDCIIEGYFKGATGALSDTVEDFYLMRLFSGGSIDTAGAFSFPNSNSVKPYFGIEIFNPYYGEGENKSGEMLGYVKTTVFNCVGDMGDDSLGKSWKKKSYTYTATTYKNAAGVEQTAVKYEYLTLAQYAALAIDTV